MNRRTMHLVHTYFSSNGYPIFIAFVIALFFLLVRVRLLSEDLFCRTEYALELDVFPWMLPACDIHVCNCIFLDGGHKISRAERFFVFFLELNKIKISQFIWSHKEEKSRYNITSHVTPNSDMLQPLEVPVFLVAALFNFEMKNNIFFDYIWGHIPFILEEITKGKITEMLHHSIIAGWNSISE